jgi:hypothetical protein
MYQEKPYAFKEFSSLLDYSANTHIRSGGICALCDAGGSRLDFDFWRQLTVEHLLGKSQGGDFKNIRALIGELFPGLDSAHSEALTYQVDEINTVTACHNCNHMTSQMKAPESMREIIESGAGDVVHTLENVREACGQILWHKRESVDWKLASVRQAFDRDVLPGLEATRLKISEGTV